MLLGCGRSARLFREIREKQSLVTSIDAWTYSPGNPGLFGISAMVDAEKYGEARQAILEEVERLLASVARTPPIILPNGLEMYELKPDAVWAAPAPLEGAQVTVEGSSGLTWTLTTGLISALRKSSIQTSAPCSGPKLIRLS